MTEIENAIVDTAADDAVVEPTVLEAVKKVNARRVKTERKPRARKAVNSAAKATTTPAQTPVETKEIPMNYDPANWMNQFATAIPGADKFQTLFADAGERGQQLVERSQKVAGEVVELTRANVEALVESGKVAAAGAQTLGQEAIARTRENLEQATQQVRSLTQAGSPTEFFQLQSEIARTQFDRMVAEGSRFAESMVKLAGEAFQPLSTRAALNAEKINEITA
ncbi:phasin family protein [Sphingomonas sp. KRR8]|uniref:phasin family protein n=1 Tax=Sphingomonas sp. KRR8 TaxID=2942996 RepID=UPI0020227342|nr:phasin family protein [Sphingomonas sp. KRR8]URD60579.1 phasin family protein [Sphingomonas sp. KRR8]